MPCLAEDRLQLQCVPMHFLLSRSKFHSARLTPGVTWLLPDGSLSLCWGGLELQFADSNATVLATQFCCRCPGTDPCVQFEKFRSSSIHSLSRMVCLNLSCHVGCDCSPREARLTNRPPPEVDTSTPSSTPRSGVLGDG